MAAAGSEFSAVAVSPAVAATSPSSSDRQADGQIRVHASVEPSPANASPTKAQKAQSKVVDAPLDQLRAELGLRDHKFSELRLWMFRGGVFVQIKWVIYAVMAMKNVYSALADLLMLGAIIKEYANPFDLLASYRASGYPYDEQEAADESETLTAVLNVVMWGYLLGTVIDIIAFLWDAGVAAKIVKSGDISDTYLNPEATRYWNLRSFEHFSLISQVYAFLTKTDKAAIWVYSSLRDFRRTVGGILTFIMAFLWKNYYLVMRCSATTAFIPQPAVPSVLDYYYDDSNGQTQFNSTAYDIAAARYNTEFSDYYIVYQAAAAKCTASSTLLVLIGYYLKVILTGISIACFVLALLLWPGIRCGIWCRVSRNVKSGSWQMTLEDWCSFAYEKAVAQTIKKIDDESARAAQPSQQADQKEGTSAGGRPAALSCLRPASGTKAGDDDGSAEPTTSLWYFIRHRGRTVPRPSTSSSPSSPSAAGAGAPAGPAASVSVEMGAYSAVATSPSAGAGTGSFAAGEGEGETVTLSVVAAPSSPSASVASHGAASA